MLTFLLLPAHTLLNGCQITWRPPYVTSHHVDSKWLALLLEIPQRFKNYFDEFQNNLQPCSGARPFCTGTPEKAWTKWNLLRQKATWMVIFLSFPNFAYSGWFNLGKLGFLLCQKAYHTLTTTSSSIHCHISIMILEPYSYFGT